MTWISLYKITCKPNGKVYIGQTLSSVARRWWRHQKSYSGCPKLKRAIDKYGAESFCVETVGEAETREIADALERFLIAANGSCENDKGYNIAPGGTGVVDRKKVCKNGHDLTVAGARDSRDRCRQCKSGYDRAAYAKLSPEERSARSAREHAKFDAKVAADPELAARIEAKQPEYNATKRANKRQRRQTDPEYDAHQRALKRAEHYRLMEKRKADPELDAKVKAQRNARQRERYEKHRTEKREAAQNSGEQSATS